MLPHKSTCRPSRNVLLCMRQVISTATYCSTGCRGRDYGSCFHFTVTCTLDNIAIMTNWPPPFPCFSFVFSFSSLFGMFTSIPDTIPQAFQSQIAIQCRCGTDCRKKHRLQYARKSTHSPFSAAFNTPLTAGNPTKWSQGNASYRERISQKIYTTSCRSSLSRR